MIPIDFLHLEDQLRNFCTQLDQVHDSIIKRPDNIGTKLAALKLGRMSEARCDRLIQEFESVKDIWQPYEIIQPERSRPKRVAAAAAIGIGVVAAVSMFSQIYSHVQLSNLISETNQQMDKHIHRLNGAVKINAQNIDALNQTFHMYHGQTLDEFLKLQDIQALSTLSIALSTLETDMANIVKGLVSLSQHRLSPSLVSPAALTFPLNDLQDDLWTSKISLSISSTYEMYQLEVSHVMLENSTLLVYVHIPCYSHQHRLRLYEYRQLPLHLPTGPDPLFIIPDVRDQYLAISSSELEFQTLTSTQLDSCKLIDSQFYCPGAAVLHRDATSNCLYAIFKRNYDHIRTACLWHVANATSITPINDTHFVLFSPPPVIDYVRVHCPPDAVTTIPINQYLSVISLDPGCRAMSDSFVFTAPLDLPVYRAQLSHGYISFDPLITDLLPLDFSNSTLTHMALTLPTIHSPFSLLNDHLFSPPSFFHLFPVSYFLIILLFVIFSVYFGRSFLLSPTSPCHSCCSSFRAGSKSLPINVDTDQSLPTSFSGSAPSGAPPAPCPSPTPAPRHHEHTRTYPCLCSSPSSEIYPPFSDCRATLP